jgi:integrase/recombinase XerD
MTVELVCAGLDTPVFPTAAVAATQTAVLRIVRKAARRAGVDVNVSLHWLRHNHTTHVLESDSGRYLHARPTDSSARYLAV